jgi:hypothetical protein
VLLSFLSFPFLSYYSTVLLLLSRTFVRSAGRLICLRSCILDFLEI